MRDAMKGKWWILVGLVLFPLTAAQAVPCTESLPVNIKNVSGHWESMGYPYLVNVRYSDDGTFFGHIVDHGRVTWRFSGIWSLTGNQMKTEYTKSSLRRIPVGTKDKDRILSIGCGFITFRTQGHYTVRYKKISSNSPLDAP